MGITIGKDIGAYEDVEPVDPDDPPEPYSEEGTGALERTDHVGTLDTTAVGPGDHEDLRNVTPTFDEADEHLAQRIDGSLEDPAADGGTSDTDADADADTSDPLDEVIVEGQGDRTDEEIAEALANADTLSDPSVDPANPVTGEPGDGQEENQAKIDEARAEGAGGDTVPELRRPEAVLDDNIPNVKEYAAEHLDQIPDLISAEEKGEARPTLLEWLEKHRLFDPDKHNVGETKDHFEASEEAEVERVKAIERAGQDRPGIMNWTREPAES